MVTKHSQQSLLDKYERKFNVPRAVWLELYRDRKGPDYCRLCKEAEELETKPINEMAVKYFSLGPCILLNKPPLGDVLGFIKGLM